MNMFSYILYFENIDIYFKTTIKIYLFYIFIFIFYIRLFHPATLTNHKRSVEPREILHAVVW
jgi:hypothetical protein